MKKNFIISVICVIICFVLLVGAIVLFFGSLIMMFVTNWIMALTAIFSSLIGFVFMASVLSKSQKYFISRQSWVLVG